MSIMTYADKLHTKFAIFNDVNLAFAKLTYPADQAFHFVSGYVQSFMISMISMIASGMSQNCVLSAIDERVKYLRADVENGVSF